MSLAISCGKWSFAHIVANYIAVSVYEVASA